MFDWIYSPHTPHAHLCAVAIACKPVYTSSNHTPSRIFPPFVFFSIITPCWVSYFLFLNEHPSQQESSLAAIAFSHTKWNDRMPFIFISKVWYCSQREGGGALFVLTIFFLFRFQNPYWRKAEENVCTLRRIEKLVDLVGVIQSAQPSLLRCSCNKIYKNVFQSSRGTEGICFSQCFPGQVGLR